MIVTTSYNPSTSTISQAQKLAQQLEATYANRQRFTIRNLQERHNVSDVLVCTETELSCYRDQQPPLFFHPGSSFFRIKRLLTSSEPEPMLVYSGVREGDTVIDCTAGLCSDAITFSFAVGATGSVIAIETDPIISLIVREGLQRYETDIPVVNDAMRRIELMQGHHLDRLRSMPDKSVDIVYFDPMFRSPVEESSGMSALRHYAYEEPILASSVTEACRVARRTVVLKEKRSSKLFSELGFELDGRRHAKIAYGVIRV